MYGSADQFRYQQRERVRAFARERFFAFYRRMFPTLAPEATFSGALHFRCWLGRSSASRRGDPTSYDRDPASHGKSLFASVAFPPGSSVGIRRVRSFAHLTVISCRRTSRIGSVTSCGAPTTRRYFPGPSSRRTAHHFRKCD